MKQIDNDSDAIPYVEVVERPRGLLRRWPFLAMAGVLLLALLGVGGSYSYQWVAKPRIDAARLDKALAAAGAADKDIAENIKAWTGYPAEQRLLLHSGNLSGRIAGVDDEIRRRGARAALDLAIREGSLQARVELGLAYRDGVFGVSDSEAALREFDGLKQDTEAGVRAGEPLAMHARALLLQQGLGVPIDRAAARELARRAAPKLPLWRLDQIAWDASRGSGLFAGVPDVELSDRLVLRQMDEGSLSAYSRGVTNCFVRFPTLESGLPLDRTIERREQGEACRKAVLLRAANSGHRPAMGELAQLSMRSDGDVPSALKWFALADDALSRDERFYFGLAKTLASDRPEALKAGVMQMRQALLQKEEHGSASVNTSIMGLLSMLDHVVKAALRRDGQQTQVSAATALRALTEADDVVEVGRRAIWFSLDLRSMLALYDAPSTVRTARALAAEMNGGAAQSTAAQTSLSIPMPAASAAQAETVAQADPEQQARTGYIAGTPRNASAGQSTFKVDNSRGSGDAVARLYLNGQKPAVRSFFIKRGEQFTAKSLSPGSFVLRYRYMGSEDTYEADQAFNLTQVEDASGTRFSNVTVTLFSVRDGNLQTRRVPPEQF